MSERSMTTAPTPITDPMPPPPPTARRGRRGPVLVGAALLVTALLAYRWFTGGTTTSSARYITAAVDRGAIEQTVSATGTVNPVSTVQVGTYVSGPIIAIDVDFNSQVKKGQRVAKIDPAPFSVKVRQEDANLANAKAKVQKDRADLVFKKLQLDRNQTLLTRNLIAQNDLDTARSNYDQAVAQLALDEAAVAQAEASLEAEKVNLAYTDILSPVDGVVVSRSVDVGQTVAASFQTPTLFLIAQDLTKMQVDTNVSESDVGRVSEGQAASFTVDAYPGAPFKGRVAQVRNAPITVQNVVTYDIVVAVDNPKLELKPGMTANVSITTAQRTGVLRVPARALRFRPEGAKAPSSTTRDHAASSTVFAMSADGTLKPVEVQVGVRDSQFAEITGGDVAEGTQVAVGTRREPTETPTTARPPGFSGGPRRF
jgi:HlyD family secretion protein